MPQNFLRIFPNRSEASEIASATAPGVVNLLGAHSGYNHGFSLGVATPHRTLVEVAESRDELCHFHAMGLGETLSCSLEGDIPEGFAGSLFGCLRVLQERGFFISPVCVLVRSTVPMGSGLASTAALQIAMLRALRRLFRFDLDDLPLARLAQQVGLEYAGVYCGMTDQFTSSIADTERMLFFDTRTFEYQLLPLPIDGELLVIDSGISSRFCSETKYIERRGECEEACRRLSVPALRDVVDVDVLSPLPPLLLKRARHVVTENVRVVEAAGGVSAYRLGELLNESQASLQDDYEVSVPAQNLLVELLRKNSHTYGARLTGAGFGGACVALVKAGSARAVADEVLAVFRREGEHGRMLIPM